MLQTFGKSTFLYTSRRMYSAPKKPPKASISKPMPKRKVEKKKRKPKKKNRIRKPKTSQDKLVPLKKGESKELKRHMFVFKSLTKKGKQRDVILKKAPLTLYKTIRLLFKLMKRGAIPLSSGQRNRLKPWANFIRSNSVGKDVKVKENVSQNGGSLASILKTVLPIIRPILALLV